MKECRPRICSCRAAASPDEPRTGKLDQDEWSGVVATGSFKNRYSFTYNAFVFLAFASAIGTLSEIASVQSQGRTVTTSDNFGTVARQAMIDIFRRKVGAAIDQQFGDSFVQ